MNKSIRRAEIDTHWSRLAGYSRAVRVPTGAVDLIFITGACSFAPDGSVHAPGDAAEQTRRIYEIIGDGLASIDANLDHIVRSRAFLTDWSLGETVGRAHHEILGHLKPCFTMVGTSALAHPDLILEIECEAVVPVS